MSNKVKNKNISYINEITEEELSFYSRIEDILSQ